MDIYQAPNLYMDTSSALFAISKEEAWTFFERFGPDRFFFGTDFPMWNHREELARFNALELTPDFRKKVLSENFSRAILHEEPARYTDSDVGPASSQRRRGLYLSKERPYLPKKSLFS